jgi:outer membrane protein
MDRKKTYAKLTNPFVLLIRIMNFTRKVSALALLITAISGAATADFVGLNIGAAQWTPDLSGSFSSGSAASIDLNSDLGYSDQTSTSLSVSFEHPIPMIPNVKYTGYDLSSKSKSTLTSPITFDGNSYSANISSTLDLSHNDLVLYYELLDNWINIDIGLDLKKFDGRVSISDLDNSSNSSSITVDETIPLFYLAARVDLPFTGLYVSANIQQLSVGDNSVEDSTLLIGYESSMGLGIEGGFKTFTLELNDASNLNTNLQYDGLFLNGYYHF